MKRLSIRRQLLFLFFPLLFGLLCASTLLSFWLVSNFSRESFDRDLVNSADSVVGRLRLREGKVVLDLPPAAQAMLKHDESDKFYYRVLSSGGEFISGDADLPAPARDLQIGVPKMVTDKISGKDVRLAEIKFAVDEADGDTVIVQVAETTNVRSRFQEKMLLSIALPQFLVIAVGLFAVWYGIMRILTPLRMLQQQLASRSQFDLSALSDVESPEEVYPLVAALNRWFARLQEELRAHERFIANAAHQLRTPLAGLKTYSSIGRQMSDPADLRRVVDELDQGIDRASRMVSQLLALARTDSGDLLSQRTKNTLDLNFLVSDVVSELVDPAIRKDVELKYENSDRPALIECEQDGIRHLVANLVENALMYTPHGGEVVVRVRQEGGVVLSVSDTGPGIPPEERERVFERFYRVVGTSGNGSGLGLSIVKEVANAHKATVSIEAPSSSFGTIIVVRFPISEFAD